MACLTGGFTGAPKTKSRLGNTAKPRNRELSHRRRQRQRKRQFYDEFPFFQSLSRLFQFTKNGKCRRISLELIS